MKNQIILWLCAIIILFLIGYSKSITDKNYPVTGTFGIESNKVSYKLDKISYGMIPYKNIIISDVKELEGIFIWEKDGEQKETNYNVIDRGLVCEIPFGKPGLKINYKIILKYRGKSYVIPEDDFITLTFWGNIPSSVNILNFILLYGGLLMSIRCALELFNKNQNLKKYAVITCTFFIILFSIVNPLRNSYKIGAINNYIPSIFDLFEPTLLLIVFCWITGTILLFFKRYTMFVTIFIVFITIFLFYLLPSA